MRNRILQLILGLGIAALFVVLSLRNVELDDVLSQITGISLWWFIPYFFVVLLVNLARSERWKMLLDDESGENNSRTVLFSGLMYSYMGNLVLPRAGEFFRAVYVARFTTIETTKLFGTIVLERIIDILMMVLMLLVTFILLVSDPGVLAQIFGEDGAWYIGQMTSPGGLIVLLSVFLMAVLFLWHLRKGVKTRELSASDGPAIHPPVDAPPVKKGLRDWAKDFVRGLISLRKLKNWPLFVGYTILIWFGYILTSLLPFYAFDFHLIYDFGWEQAFVITVIGAVGVSLPSPGGIGTYHYLVQSGLSVLYLVPASTALSYATISHAANLVCLIVVSVVLFFANMVIARRNESDSIPFSNLFR
jgi:glycosyltransferase 2 family protein